MDGGAFAAAAIDWRGMGLSPHGRGSLEVISEDQFLLRSIPAWTGEPVQGQSGACARWVYPRMDGGANIFSNDPSGPVGLSPHGRGSL